MAHGFPLEPSSLKAPAWEPNFNPRVGVGPKGGQKQQRQAGEGVSESSQLPLPERKGIPPPLKNCSRKTQTEFTLTLWRKQFSRSQKYRYPLSSRLIHSHSGSGRAQVCLTTILLHLPTPSGPIADFRRLGIPSQYLSVHNISVNNFL